MDKKFLKMDINDADSCRSGAHCVVVTCGTMQGDSPPEEWGDTRTPYDFQGGNVT
jgi:hypothetical protein